MHLRPMQRVMYTLATQIYLNKDLANDESVDGFGIGTGIKYKF